MTEQPEESEGPTARRVGAVGDRGWMSRLVRGDQDGRPGPDLEWMKTIPPDVLEKAVTALATLAA